MCVCVGFNHVGASATSAGLSSLGQAAVGVHCDVSGLSMSGSWDHMGQTEKDSRPVCTSPRLHLQQSPVLRQVHPRLEPENMCLQSATALDSLSQAPFMNSTSRR